jgi:hypothetical protein
MGNTKVDLVRDLKELIPQSGERDALIAAAERGEFHDFDSDLAAPKLELLKFLTQAGMDAIVEKLKDGAYDDEPPTYDQQMEMRQELGPRMYDAMMGGKPKKPARA